MERPIFDDWAVRSEKAFASRRRDYRVVFALLIVIWLGFLVVSIFYWYAILAFAMWCLVIVTIYLEWLKVKNHHLRIFESKICIVDRFGREKVYPVEYRNCTLVLKGPAGRSGGVRLLFIDNNKRKICQYEDMLNYGAFYGAPLTAWEQAVMELPMTLVDEGSILKNRP